ncbi:hypothetical protein WJX81_004272, partial [Elliptochloris bilobata]
MRHGPRSACGRVGRYWFQQTGSGRAGHFMCEPACDLKLPGVQPASETEAVADSGEAHDMTCAICLDTIALEELSIIKGCEHAYCSKCILAWAVHKDPPWCPQCKAPFSRLVTYRALDGTLHDFPALESVCLLKRACWFQAHLREAEAVAAAVPTPFLLNAADAAAIAEAATLRDPNDYGRYYEEYDDDEEVEAFYFSAAAGRARITLGNRRFGNNGYIASGRMQARPAQPARPGEGKAAAKGEAWTVAALVTVCTCASNFASAQDGGSLPALQRHFFKADAGSYGQQYPLPRSASEWADILRTTPGITPAPPLALSGIQELGFKHVYGGLLSLQKAKYAPFLALQALGPNEQLAVSSEGPQPPRRKFVRTESASTNTSVATYNSTINGTLDGLHFSLTFRRCVDDPTLSGLKLVAGNYSVRPADDTGAHLALDCGGNARPFTLDLSGSTLVMQDYAYQHMRISNCANLTVAGPTLVHNSLGRLPFTQATVLGMTADTRNWTVQVQPGYAADWLANASGSKYVAFGAGSRLLKANSSALYPSGAPTALPNRTFALGFDYPVEGVALGDQLAVVRQGAAVAHGVVLQNSTSTTISRMAVLTAGGVAFHEQDSCSNNTFLGVAVRPYPGRIAAGSPPALLSSNAQGIHSYGSITGPHVARSVLVSTGDDGIAVGGGFSLVVAVDAGASAMTLAMSATAPLIMPNDFLGMFSGGTWLGAAPVAAVVAVDRPDLPAGQTSRSLPLLDLKPGSAITSYFNVTVVAFPGPWKDSLAFDCLAADLTKVGAGTRVEDTLVANNNGRGVVLRAGNSTLQRNAVWGPKLWGVQVAPDAWHSMESGWPSAALDLSGAPSARPANATGVADVRIEDNRIAGADTFAVLVTDADRVQVSRNQVEALAGCGKGAAVVVESSERSASTSEEEEDLQIEGIDKNYCDEFVCTSSPAVEQNLRALARDLTRLRTWTLSLFAKDVRYQDRFRSFTGKDKYVRLKFVADCIGDPKV